MASTTATTTSASSSTRASAPISIWNILNLLAYLANAGIVYAIGVFGLLGKGNNAELSNKYQTLLTPAPWAFGIWGVIFIAQFLWAILQLAVPRYRIKAMQYVHNYFYILVCLAQIGWTVAFGLEIIWLSMVFMTLILISLIHIVRTSRRQQAQHHETVWCEEYAILEFPFTVHTGWIIAATVVNANVVLVAYNVNINLEFFAAFVSFVLVLVASSVFLALPDFTIPLVLIWALTGVYVELGHPTESISTKFTERSLPLVQKTAAIAIFAIVVSFLIRLYTSWKEYRLSARSSDQARSLQEPLTPPAAKTTHQNATSTMI